MRLLEFNWRVATALERTPGSVNTEINDAVAGRSGRILKTEFIIIPATAFVRDAPGITYLEFNRVRAGRSGRIHRREFKLHMATAFVFIVDISILSSIFRA